MSAPALNMKTYLGSLSGTPVVLNPQLDANGMVASFCEVINGGAQPFTFTYIAGPFEGTAITVPALSYYSLPGPCTQASLAGTGTNYIVNFSQGVGDLPRLSLLAGSGGGGGGLAPADAPYLLNGPDTGGTLTSSVDITNLVGGGEPLFFNQDIAGSSTEVKNVIALTVKDLTHAPEAGGGIILPFGWTSSSGLQSIGLISMEWDDVSDPAHPTGLMRVLLGADQIEAMQLSLPGVLDSSVFKGILFTTSGDHSVGASTGNILYGSADGNVYVSATAAGKLLRLQADDAATFFQLNTGGEIAVNPGCHIHPTSGSMAMTAGGSGTVGLYGNVGLTAVIVSDNGVQVSTGIGLTNSWLFDETSGNLLGDGSHQIKNLASGTLAKDAATLDQVTAVATNLANGKFYVSGAPTTGLTNAINLQNVTGVLSLKASGNVTVESTAGDIDLTSDDGDVNITPTSGKFTVTASGVSGITTSSVVGLQGSAFGIVATSSSGNVEAENLLSLVSDTNSIEATAHTNMQLVATTGLASLVASAGNTTVSAVTGQVQATGDTVNLLSTNATQPLNVSVNSHVSAFNADGTTTLPGDLTVAGKIHGVTAGTAGTDATNVTQMNAAISTAVGALTATGTATITSGNSQVVVGVGTAYNTQPGIVCFGLVGTAITVATPVFLACGTVSAGNLTISIANAITGALTPTINDITVNWTVSL